MFTGTEGGASRPVLVVVSSVLGPVRTSKNKCCSAEGDDAMSDDSISHASGDRKKVAIREWRDGWKRLLLISAFEKGVDLHVLRAVPRI